MLRRVFYILVCGESRILAQTRQNIRVKIAGGFISHRHEALTSTFVIIKSRAADKDEMIQAR
jgi:hypothetical protein